MTSLIRRPLNERAKLLYDQCGVMDKPLAGQSAEIVAWFMGACLLLLEVAEAEDPDRLQSVLETVRNAIEDCRAAEESICVDALLPLINAALC